jgi:hypothetical protein
MRLGPSLFSISSTLREVMPCSSADIQRDATERVGGARSNIQCIRMAVH